MTYNQPEIVALGNSINVIEHLGAKPYPNLADWVLGKNPAQCILLADGGRGGNFNLLAPATTS